MTDKALTEGELRNWVLSLPPDSIKSLEEALKSIRDNHFHPTECNASNSSRDGKQSVKDKSEVGDDIDVSPPSRTNSPTSSNASIQSRNKFGKTYENGRRNLKGEEVSQEEASRRAKRRERNRLAAAKCRKRRQDKIETLQERVLKLKGDLDHLNSNIEINASEQRKLDAIIASHKCNLQDNHSNSQNGMAVRPKSLRFENNSETQESTSTSGNVFICSLSPQLISLSPLLTPSTMKLVLDSINNHQFDSSPTSLLKDESSQQITIDSSTLFSSVTTPSQTFSRSLSLLNLMSPNSDLLNMNLFSSPSLKIAATIASSNSSTTYSNHILSDHHIKQEDE